MRKVNVTFEPKHMETCVEKWRSSWWDEKCAVEIRCARKVELDLVSVIVGVDFEAVVLAQFHLERSLLETLQNINLFDDKDWSGSVFEGGTAMESAELKSILSTFLKRTKLRTGCSVARRRPSTRFGRKRMGLVFASSLGLLAWHFAPPGRLWPRTCLNRSRSRY